MRLAFLAGALLLAVPSGGAIAGGRHLGSAPEAPTRPTRVLTKESALQLPIELKEPYLTLGEALEREKSLVGSQPREIGDHRSGNRRGSRGPS